MQYLLSHEFSLHLLAGFCAALGLLIIATRAPLLVFPEATRKVYLQVVGTDLRIRLMGALLAGFALGLILCSRYLASFPEVLLFMFGWALALFTAGLMLLLTFLFKEIVTALLENMDELLLRLIGLVSVLIGLFFIYLAVVIRR